MSTIANERWQTKQPENPYHNVGDTAYQMHQRRFFGTKCWLGYTPFQFNNDTINKCLREIKPSNCAVLLRSQSFAGEGGFEEEYWVGTKYKVVENKHVYKPNKIPFPREFRLPEENKYVIKNLPQKVDDSQSWPAPKRVLRSSTAELWFKTDSKFNIPRAYICVNFLTNLASKSIKNQVMMDMLLFATAGQCQGSHDFTLASEAGIECRVLGVFADAAQDNRVTNNTRPVGIMVSGYDPKLPEIILRAMDMLLKFRLHNMDILGQLINQLQGAYQGTMIGDPLRVCSELGTRLLINNYYSLPERLEFTRNILRSDFGLLQQFIMEFHQFQQQLITKSFYQVHIEGNMTQKEATDIYKQITKLAQAKGPGSLKVKSATSGPKIRNHETPVACKVAGMDPNSEMTFCSLTWVLGKFQSSRRLSALATFVSSMMHQPAFDYLRTKKALGYIAGSREWSRSGVKAIAIECNTNVNRVSVEEVEALMTKCAGLMLKQFEALTDEQYKTSKAAYVKLLAKPADSMDHYFGTNQIEIYDGTQRFSRKEEESAELMKIPKDEFVSFFREYVIKNKRRMFVAVEGCSQHTRPDGLFHHLPLENADYNQISDFRALSTSFY